MVSGRLEMAVSAGRRSMLGKGRAAYGKAWSGEAPAWRSRVVGTGVEVSSRRMSGVVRVWRVPFGYLILIWRKQQRWVAFRPVRDLRRVYEILTRRGVPKNMIRVALVRANPAEARAHNLD